MLVRDDPAYDQENPELYPWLSLLDGDVAVLVREICETIRPLHACSHHSAPHRIDGLRTPLRKLASRTTMPDTQARIRHAWDVILGAWTPEDRTAILRCLTSQQLVLLSGVVREEMLDRRQKLKQENPNGPGQTPAT